MLSAHAGANRKQVKDHLTFLKAGGQRAPNELLSKEASKPVSSWELHQQRAQDGWWPILVTISEPLREQRLQPRTSAYLFASPRLALDQQANAWRHAIESSAAISSPPQEIQRYIDARAHIVSELGAQFKYGHGESSGDVNLARKAVIGLLGEASVEEYVRAYTEVLRSSGAGAMDGEWRWRAWCL